jgi:ribosome-associated protein
MKAVRATDEEIAQRVRQAVAAAEGRKAEDLRVLHLARVSDFTDYFLVMTGNSERQVQAIASAVDDALRGVEVRPLHIEGYPGGTWVLMDYGAFVVHVFQQETRRYYGLEGLWADAPEVTDDFRS